MTAAPPLCLLCPSLTLGHQARDGHGALLPPPVAAPDGLGVGRGRGDVRFRPQR